MPTLRHRLPERPFDISKSEVVQCLLGKSDVQQWLFDQMKNRKWIVFDSNTGMWRGKDVI
jgi:hypothetical protein